MDENGLNKSDSLRMNGINTNSHNADTVISVDSEASVQAEQDSKEENEEPRRDGCCKRFAQSIKNNKKNIALTTAVTAVQLLNHNTTPDINNPDFIDDASTLGLATVISHLAINKNVAKSSFLFLLAGFALVWLDEGLKSIGIPFETRWKNVCFIAFFMRMVIEVQKNKMREAVRLPA